MCEIDFDNVEGTDLETLSKAIQRVGAVGYLPKTLDVVNRILEGIGVDALPEDTDLDEVLPESTSKSGEGMKEGLPSGTGDATGGGDTSSNNNDNTA
jgi:hypothetical protein